MGAGVGSSATEGGSPEGIAEGDEVVVPGTLYIKADGRAVRLTTIASAHAEFQDGVASKDVKINATSGAWCRVYLPEGLANMKVPVVVFYHGGGFCMGSPDFPLFTCLCEDVARVSQVVVISMSYRLAPDHRLPAAYEDADTSILWLQKQAELQAKGEGDEPWLIKHADFSKCFLMGESAGGNIVHHLGVRFAETDLSPLSFKGFVFLVPFWGKEERTESELLYGAVDPIAKLTLLDRLWELALPLGASRDHPYSNIFGSDQKLPLPKALLVVNAQDTIYDRQMKYYDALRKVGRNVQLLEIPEGGHGFRMLPQFASEAHRVQQAIRAFVHEDTESA